MLRLVRVCFICLFVQVGDEELGIALMWAASAGKVGDHIMTKMALGTVSNNQNGNLRW